MKHFIFLLSLVTISFVPKQDQTALTDEEIQVLLERHNFWREDVGINEKLVWSENLARLAADWARELQKKNCGFEHRPENDYGENLFMGTSGFYSPREVVDAWASEKTYYNHKKNKCKSGEICGHYTQIVWRTTKSVGCAKVTCGGNDIWLCNYDPPSN